MTLRALFAVACLSVVAGCTLYDSEAFYDCLSEGSTAQACKAADAAAREESKRDATPPRVENVCVSRSYQRYSSSKCERWEQQCVWGPDYEGPRECLVVYPQGGPTRSPDQPYRLSR